MMYKNHQCGVYTIRCIPSNKIYVGSSINIERRWNQHRRVLNKGRHPNKKLQNAWKKYKEDAFKFEVEQECHLDILRQKEQQIIVKYNSVVNGFNGTYKTEWNVPVIKRTLKFNKRGKLLNRCLTRNEKKVVSKVGQVRFIDSIMASGTIIKKVIVNT